MPNMLEYLSWRGDLSLDQDGLNENDELIFSQLAYVAFDGLVPGIDALEFSVMIADAAMDLLKTDPDAQKIHQTFYMWEKNKELLQALAESKRFARLRLKGYVSSISSGDEKQFAAITIMLGDGSTLVSFRGTDDSLVGWKEDLNMAFQAPIPAQVEAVTYLSKIALNEPGDLRLLGHSKGGNLAVYAAACSSPWVQNRIVSVTNHDGPGLDEETFTSDGYQRMRDRLKVYIPCFSVVGMLLEQEENYIVVQSDAISILQHDAFSWQMVGTKMLRAENPSEKSLQANHIIRLWLESLSAKQRKLFIDVVYEIARATYGEMLPSQEIHWPANAQATISALKNLDADTRSLFFKVIGDLFSTAVKSVLPWRKVLSDEPLD